ncbi:hypothetical protein PBF_04718 [Cytobacillus firmus DS1]|uniref:Uncharacterized protein n=1 Tax=Cytobacillus firmus DS1 TaxID=1307436 RepID=W7LIW7_CYTFI|nr:hypothetical protein PBF_04718 [Cytobacillus firmus DS1]
MLSVFFFIKAAVRNCLFAEFSSLFAEMAILFADLPGLFAKRASLFAGFPILLVMFTFTHHNCQTPKLESI